MLAPAARTSKRKKSFSIRASSARVAAVDAQLGIVLLYLDFGNTKQYGPGRALVTFEAFKIYGGQIHAVNAVLRMASASAASGWGPELPVKVPPAH